MWPRRARRGGLKDNKTMMPITESDLQAMRQRTERARNPEKAKANDVAKVEKWARGEESKLQDAIQQFAEMKGCYVLRARMDCKTTFRKGHPDLSIWGPDKRSVLIEAKTEGNEPDADQIKAINELRIAGAAVTVAYNLKQACDFIIHHLFTQ